MKIKSIFRTFLCLFVCLYFVGCAAPTLAPTVYSAPAVNTERIKTGISDAQNLNRKALSDAERARRIIAEDDKLLKLL